MIAEIFKDVRVILATLAILVTANRLNVCNVLGRLVKCLQVADQSGRYIWKGLDNGGRPVASGINFYRPTAGSKIRSMILLR